MLYHWYELSHTVVKPARVAADSFRIFVDSPFNPLTHTPLARLAAAACEVFERTTRRYGKPDFGIRSTRIDGREVAVSEEVVWEKPFCRLVHFSRDVPAERREASSRILLIAPMSGHFATLLRGTVETFLPHHEVYITDWRDARDIPASTGRFDLDDYIDYVREILTTFGGDVHVFAVCQPAVPVLAAVALMEADDDPAIPLSLILAGGPVDTRISPTEVNRLAERRGTGWFRNNVISIVPWTRGGSGREVYPGFLQLTGFMSMNLDRHARAHKDMFMHLVHGDGDSAEKHREFYDEYLAVMDLTAEFFLQTIDTVFVRHALPKGKMLHRGRLVDLTAIRRVGLLTIEGEKDDITGRGQCAAAIDLCVSIPKGNKAHFECPGVGHYGIFNGSRFRNEIAPLIARFTSRFDPRGEFLGRESCSDHAAGLRRASRSAIEISSLAFTFQPANDTEPDAHAARLRGKEEEDADELATPDVFQHRPVSTPFKLVALAGNIMIDNLFRMHAR